MKPNSYSDAEKSLTSTSLANFGYSPDTVVVGPVAP
jgi:hypothetical protein